MNLAAKSAVRGIEAGQMSIRIGIAQIVDGNDLEVAAVLALVQCPQNIAADSPVAIDANFDHRSSCASRNYQRGRSDPDLKALASRAVKPTQSCAAGRCVRPPPCPSRLP